MIGLTKDEKFGKVITKFGQAAFKTYSYCVLKIIMK